MIRIGVFAFAAMLLGLCASGADAVTSTISTWNVGSGQYQDNFQLATDANFTGGALELGLRTVYRTSLTRPDENNGIYTVLSGFQENGVVGASGTNVNKNRWNTDYHIYYAGGVQSLDELTLTITTTTSNPLKTGLSLGVFNMLTASNDADTVAGQDYAHYIQDSNNPKFADFFVQPFDMNLNGT